MPVSSIVRNFFGPEATVARTLGLVLAASGAIIAIALGFEFIGGYRPCPLCLQQRYAYYFAILVSALSLVAIRPGVRGGWLRLALCLIALGYVINTGLGVQHSGVEWKWWAGPDTCAAALPKLSGGAGLDLSQPVIRCDAAPWRLAGLSFAGWNAVLSLALALLAGWGALGSRSQPARTG
jgi:disulfide bond formation protein DsbB